MMLTDRDLNQYNDSLVTPFNPAKVQPSSYDLSLFNKLAVPIPYREVDLRTDEPGDFMKFVEFDRYDLHPGRSVLGCSNETVRCPNDLSARVEGKSTLGRLFLAVHVTAGVIDAGFNGQITLEIVNHGPWTIVLWPGMSIAQLSFIKLTGPVETPYGSKLLGSHYLGQKGPTPASGRRGP